MKIPGSARALFLLATFGCAAVIFDMLRTERSHRMDPPTGPLDVICAQDRGLPSILPNAEHPWRGCGPGSWRDVVTEGFAKGVATAESVSIREKITRIDEKGDYWYRATNGKSWSPESVVRGQARTGEVGIRTEGITVGSRTIPSEVIARSHTHVIGPFRMRYEREEWRSLDSCLPGFTLRARSRDVNESLIDPVQTPAWYEELPRPESGLMATIAGRSLPCLSFRDSSCAGTRERLECLGIPGGVVFDRSIRADGTGTGVTLTDFLCLK